MKFIRPQTPVHQFTDFQMPEALLKALNNMKITKPTPIQSLAVPAAIQGQDVIAVAQTGSGKTLAYALSVLTQLERKPESRALVLAPSREMAQQIHKVFTELCVEMPASVCLAIGGATGSKQASELKKKPRVIIATPGRMNDHLLGNKLLLQGVEFLVVDEADRMLDMGFAPQLKAIENTLRGQWQTLMFSASFGPKVESVAELFMNDEVLMIRTEDAEAPVETLKQKVFFVDREQKSELLLDELNKTKGSVLVFTGYQEACEEVGKFLESYGFESDYIHGAMSQGQRNKILRKFREGEIRILVTTDLLARGIDVPSVSYVINFDLPFQSEDFLHRIGRTARAGRSGQAFTFITPSDLRNYKKLRKYIGGAEEVKMDPRFKFIDRSQKNQQDPTANKNQRANNFAKGQKAKGSSSQNASRKQTGAPNSLKGLFSSNKSKSKTSAKRP
jgi:ATP-dependent RNA helicase RhlE